MSEYTNFEIGQKFPMPIATQADGAMFQVDANGAMFILQLSRTDVIAREAFRTGEMEFAFYEQDGLLFLLYQIDGIFKEGWGDAPLSLHNLKEGLMPTEKSLQDKTLHLYLVDTTLQILLAQRDIELSDKCQSVIRKHVEEEPLLGRRLPQEGPAHLGREDPGDDARNGRGRSARRPLHPACSADARDSQKTPLSIDRGSTA